ncbi:isovaleryl-CoA dehydrogenase [Comamonas serinivorans]|uniref:Isovaleryl-CoA dehydrogenase n=1 Tax=Comamonas serinivorans TaxID=1082851 RepID=A0A1Y0EMC1_9BURK|nr:isovaleryl-CoA dehydrogenase [Comamonas serinivorans]ARU04442.1 isovaleryl-CoA dehydrogenase [Comamonas serinivorans]
MSVKAQFLTHAVTNQPQPLPDYNAWTSDTVLQACVAREGGGWADDHLTRHGEFAGGEMMALGQAANRHKPILHPFDRHGRRIDEVEFHPAYHELMRRLMANQVHNFSWVHQGQPGAAVVRTALGYLSAQADAGTGCPLSMTFSAVPALRHDPALFQAWAPRLMSSTYDPRTLPADQKQGCTMGMGMTEKQGGSDVRANTTRAIRQSDGSYEVVGHKFFFSAPMCDAHLVLAQTEGGMTTLLMPRVLPDGSLNAVRIQRLKDKLGDWSNASSEVEFQGATAHIVGEEGRGIAYILDMVMYTRLGCIAGSASGMRQALVQALHHTRQRSVFGKTLIEQPLMRNVLADLALESEAATALAMRAARAVDASERDPMEAAFARIVTPVGKYYVCKRAPAFVNEAQECLGGIGYVEENILPRLYRQAPLNSIWEGSGNVQCLDVLRALRREPETREAFFAELLKARGLHAALDREIEALNATLEDVQALELRSRYVVERMALAVQAAILLTSGQDAIAQAFCESRLNGAHGLTFGTLPAGAPFDTLMARAMPAF